MINASCSFYWKMVDTNTSHSIWQISWIVTRHKKNGNFSLKFIKPSVSFGYNRKMLPWALIVDPTEMRCGFLNWNRSGVMPIVRTWITSITEKEVVLRKTGMKKKYMRAQRMVYTRLVKKIYQAFVETGFACSVGTFIKYKLFYITAPTEREKELCLCKKCLNAHLLLARISNFQKVQKLHLCINDFLNDQDLHDHRTK